MNFLEANCKRLLEIYQHCPGAAMSFAEILRRMPSDLPREAVFDALHSLLISGSMQMIHTLDLTILFEVIEELEDDSADPFDAQLEALFHEWDTLLALTIPALKTTAVPLNPVAVDAVLDYLLKQLYSLLSPLVAGSAENERLIEHLNQVSRLRKRD